jgi:hypothetical protein
LRKALLVAGALFLGVLIAGGAWLARLASRLEGPELEKALLERARAALGTDVRASGMDVSLLSGVTLKGLRVANPAPFPGDLLAADAFVLRYRLLPLLRGRLEVERMALEKPSLALAMDARGVFNYERLAKAQPPPPPGSAAGAAAVLPLRIVLRDLGVRDGSLVVLDPAKSKLLASDGISFRSAFEVVGGVATGSGDARAASVKVSDLLLVRDVRSPLVLSREAVRLSPVRGAVAGGEAEGEVTVRLAGGFRWNARLSVKRARVETLLAEAGAAGGLAGALAGTASFEGTGGAATVTGRGQATVEDCRAENARLLAVVAAALQVPEVARADFEECRVEFTQRGTRVTTPVLSLRGEAVRLSGKGTVDLSTSALDYQMTLGLSPRLHAKLLRPELRAAFKDRGDSYPAMDFRVTGTTTDPKTDILLRLGRAAATEAAKGQIDRLLKKVF